MQKKVTVPPWKKAAPKGSHTTKLTNEEKAQAKARAQKAGRPYPNLVDNMYIARKKREAEKHEA